MILAGIVCVGFAGLDEYHQSFVDSRTPAVKDVGIDSIGCIIGILLVQAFCWSVLNNPVKKKKRESTERNRDRQKKRRKKRTIKENIKKHTKESKRNPEKSKTVDSLIS